jgi:hypothetical protein
VFLFFALPFLTMMELSPLQMKVVEELFAAGFRPVVIPPYEGALCMRRGECAAVLTPVRNAGLRLLAPPSYIIDGNFSVKLRRGDREVFVWKKSELEATSERLNELATFREELTAILQKAFTQ